MRFLATRSLCAWKSSAAAGPALAKRLLWSVVVPYAEGAWPIEKLATRMFWTWPMCVEVCSFSLPAVKAWPADVSLENAGLAVALRLKLAFLEAFLSWAIAL